MIWVSNTTENILRKAIFNFAKQLNEPSEKVQLILTTYDAITREPAFRVMVMGRPAKIKQDDGRFDEHVTFLQVLGVDVDFLNYGEAALPFFAEKLEVFAKEQNCSADHISLIMYSDATLKVYKKDQPGIPENEREEVVEGPLYMEMHKLIPAHTAEQLMPVLDENKQPVLKAGTQEPEMSMQKVDIPDKKVFVKHMNLRVDVFGLDPDDK